MQLLMCIKGHKDEPRMIKGKTYTYAHDFVCECKARCIMVEGIEFTTLGQKGYCSICNKLVQLPTTLRGLPPSYFIPLNNPGIDLQVYADDISKVKETERLSG